VTTPRVRGWRLAVGLLGAVLTAAAGAESRIFELQLKDGRLPETQRLLKVQQGDEVTLKWTTDRPFTLHVHGYDLEAKLAPPAAAELRFTAKATGRFPMEIHGPGVERTVGHLEVHPR
jgi:hypothetical protein